MSEPGEGGFRPGRRHDPFPLVRGPGTRKTGGVGDGGSTSGSRSASGRNPLELTSLAAGDMVPADHQLRQRGAAGPLDYREEEEMAKEVFCTIGIDVDAVAGWLGSYGGEDSPCDITRGLFAGEIGSPRLLKMFDKYGLRTTWFIPGH